MKTIAIFFLLFFTCSLVNAQIELQKEEVKFDLNDFDEVGKTKQIFKSDGTFLAPNNYVIHFEKRDINLAMYFTIADSSMVDGTVVVKNEQGQVLMRSFIEKGIVQRYEKIDPESNNISEESFAKKDTIISIYYNKYKQIREEYRTVNGTEIYNRNCYYSTETDSLGSCTVKDKVTGKYESYNEKGILEERTKTKGLPEGIAKQTENFDGGKLTSKEITYTNGKTKTISSDGSYIISIEINGGEKVQEYNRAGKLIKSYIAYYPTISNLTQ